MRQLRAAVAALGISFSVLCGVALSAAADSDEHALQALFISKLGRYVTWPDEAFRAEDSPIVVGVLGEAPLGDALQSALAESSARGRGYELRSLVGVSDAADCHMVVVTDRDRRSLRKLARELKGNSVLSIATDPHFAEYGGVLGLEMYRGKIAFDVNHRAARRAEIEIDSRLLRLATKVY